MKIKQFDLWGNEVDITEEVKMTEIEKLENGLILIRRIEPETKLEKLKEERREFNREYRKYITNPTTDNMDLLISELIDLNIVVLQLAICKHRYNLAEIYARLKDKVKLTVSIGVLMKSKRIGYPEARRRLR